MELVKAMQEMMDAHQAKMEAYIKAWGGGGMKRKCQYYH
jgi:hypothetical protein